MRKAGWMESAVNLVFGNYAQMNTKHVTDTDERKKLKRAARKAAPAETGRAKGVDRGSLKRKVKKIVKGTRKR